MNNIIASFFSFFAHDTLEGDGARHIYIVVYVIYMGTITIPSKIRASGGSKFIHVPSTIARAMKLEEGRPVTLHIISASEIRVVVG